MSRKKGSSNNRTGIRSRDRAEPEQHGAMALRCPNDDDERSRGLARLLCDLPFDIRTPSVLDCPLCGEHVRLKKGVCPKCNEPIFAEAPGSGWDEVRPLITADGIVFLHFDVESGELSYLQGGSGRFGVQRVELTLDNPEAHNENWTPAEDAIGPDGE